MKNEKFLTTRFARLTQINLMRSLVHSIKRALGRSIATIPLCRAWGRVFIFSHTGFFIPVLHRVILSEGISLPLKAGKNLI